MISDELYSYLYNMEHEKVIDVLISAMGYNDRSVDAAILIALGATEHYDEETGGTKWRLSNAND